MTLNIHEVSYESQVLILPVKLTENTKFVQFSNQPALAYLVRIFDFQFTHCRLKQFLFLLFFCFFFFFLFRANNCHLVVLPCAIISIGGVAYILMVYSSVNRSSLLLRTYILQNDKVVVQKTYPCDSIYTISHVTQFLLFTSMNVF